jgi:hypothetical protein
VEGKNGFEQICWQTIGPKKVFGGFAGKQMGQKKFLEDLSADNWVKKSFWRICWQTNGPKKVFGGFVGRQLSQKKVLEGFVGRQLSQKKKFWGDLSADKWNKK